MWFDDEITAKETGYRPHGNHCSYVRAQGCGDLEHCEDRKANDVQSSPPKGFGQRCKYQRTNAQKDYETGRSTNYGIC